MKTVWFVRHGQSTSNAGEVTRSPESPELTALGHKQAAVLAGIVPRRPDLIVTSKYVRTQQTAAPSLARFDGVAHVEWPVHEFTYVAAELYNGTTWPQRMPIAAEYWQRLDPCEQPVGGESYANMMARVAEVFQMMREESAEFMLIFSHGILMKALLWHWLMGGDVERCIENMAAFAQFFRTVSVPNTAVMKMVFSAESTPSMLPTIHPIQSAHVSTS